MSRLPIQWHRLFACVPGTGSELWPALADDQGQVRAMVLGLARPGGSAALASLWQGVQADLGLPAPAIAVDGQRGYQLWFSLAQARPAAQADAFLAALCRRYLGEQADAARIEPQPGPVPALQPDGERWSAFVAADLAPMFEDEPWLDIPPNPDGQAELLARLASIEPAAFDEAMAKLEPAEALPDAAAPPAPVPAGSVAPPSAPRPRDPQAFLLDVMRDEQVALALRIEAAKALLPYATNDGDERGR
ncbi:hypothetical protein [Sphaerotilus microaerophilus]|uniref:Uncharacterized protein n=1 Tax=Sphaerotilus microaerophilus TaxID=2914710 RepID=A0ABM7YQT7_9BURK|nr:hypothetical protein [Sphaerotilus sp. FB-5]BDI06903.1 hypothetical protein CATMQ487_38730 [Sphaerotilus sp. FB-5]